MKPLFIFCCLLLTLQSKAANDTLTCAQVYNFNVGDTFDYKYASAGYSDEPPIEQPYYNVTYYRVEITGKFYSQNQDTLFYPILKQYYPSSTYPNGGLAVDTQIITNLPRPAILYNYYMAGDSANYFADSVVNVALFTDRAVNKVFLSYFESWRTIYFAEGVGQIFAAEGGGDGSGEEVTDTTTLIYYSKSGQTWGTPATIAIASGIPNMTQQTPSIALFPTINKGQFKVNINAPNNPSPQLIIYDLTGREVKRTCIANGTNNIALDNTSTGMYLWSVTSNGATLKSGKLIIQ